MSTGRGVRSVGSGQAARWPRQAAGFRAPGRGLPGFLPPPGGTRPPPGPMLHFTLPNVQAGESFRSAIQIHPAGAPALRWLTIDLPPARGLQVDVARGEVSGTVQAAGEVPIRLQFCFLADASARPYSAQITLLVTPNPKSLWLNKPSDPQAPFWRPDHTCTAQHHTGYRLLAASQRGRSHAHRGGFREDDYWIAQAADGWSLALVADGAGSARFSRQGAHLACRVTGDALAKGLATGGAARLAAARAAHPDPAAEAVQTVLAGLIAPALQHALAAIEAAAASQSEPGITVRDFASTLLLVMCQRGPAGHCVVCFSVGDGAVALYRKKQSPGEPSCGMHSRGGASHPQPSHPQPSQQPPSVLLLSAGDGGDYAGQTCFLDVNVLNPATLAQRLRVVQAEDMTALLLMTDGVSDPHFDPPAALGQVAAWDALWQTLQQAMSSAAVDGATDNEARARHLLGWLDFWVPGHHDDRTLLIVEPCDA